LAGGQPVLWREEAVEIARALAMRPRSCCSTSGGGDEPGRARLAHAIIREIRDSGVGIVLIEHHMRLVMTVCDRIAVLNFGQKIAEGRRRDRPATRARIDAIAERD